MPAVVVGLGIGDWGLEIGDSESRIPNSNPKASSGGEIGDWGLGFVDRGLQIPNPQSPRPAVVVGLWIRGFGVRD